MKDMQIHLEKLLRDASEYKLISDLATDIEKRELFARMSEHFTALATELESAIARRVNRGQSA